MTESEPTMPDDPAPGHGERRLRDNRRRYRNIILGLLGSGAAIGAIGAPIGYHAGRYGFHDHSVPPALQWLAIAGVILFVIAVVIGSWIYFREIDELEYEANKFAGLIGINVYAMLYLCWWPLGRTGVTPAPNGDAIFLITMAATIAAFCWRRFR